MVALSYILATRWLLKQSLFRNFNLFVYCICMYLYYVSHPSSNQKITYSLIHTNYNVNDGTFFENCIYSVGESGEKDRVHNGYGYKVYIYVFKTCSLLELGSTTPHRNTSIDGLTPRRCCQILRRTSERRV